jgi:hypothetical protein
MDYEYWIRLALCGAKFHYEPRVLAGSRFYAETKTLGARVKVHAEINDMLKRALGNTPTRWILGYSHVVADDTFGIRRAKRAQHLVAVTLVSLYSALRWNKKIPAELLKILYSGFVGIIKATIRA